MPLEIINNCQEEIEYEQAMQKMKLLFDDICNGEKNDTLWLLQHKNVYTVGLGENKSINNCCDNYDNKKIDFIKTNRGGLCTYHGSGQLIIYPIINLKRKYKDKLDIKMFVTNLEKVVIAVLKDFNIIGFLIPNQRGVWVNYNYNVAKIASIGIRISKWTTTHGVSINVFTDLSYFNNIIPCGIEDVQMISIRCLIEEDLLTDLELMQKLSESATKHFVNIFEYQV